MTENEEYLYEFCKRINLELEDVAIIKEYVENIKEEIWAKSQKRVMRLADLLDDLRRFCQDSGWHNLSDEIYCKTMDALK